MSASPADTLQSPPRPVPLNLRLALVSNLAVLIGGLILAGGLFFSILFLSTGDLFGGIRLWFSSREARGTFVSAEPVGWGSGSTDWERKRYDRNSRIYRVEYDFELPDGSEIRGASFVRGRRYVDRISKVTTPNYVIAIEYVPSAPQINRIRNSRTSPYGPGILFLLLIPTAGAFVALIGVVHALQVIRLLRNGAAANATITRCRCVEREHAGASKRWLPFEQFREEMHRTVSHAIEEPGVATRSKSVWFTVFGRSFGTSQTEEISASEFKQGFKSHITLFRVFLYGLFSAWTLLVGFIVWVTWFGSDPQQTDLFERIAITVVLLLLATFFIVFGIVVTRFLRKAEGAVSGKLKLSELPTQLECQFEFTTPQGRTLKAQALVPELRVVLEDGPNATALYDRDHPKRAQLLDALPVSVRVSPAGELAASGTIWRTARLIGVVIILFVTVWIGLLAADSSAATL